MPQSPQHLIAWLSRQYFYNNNDQNQTLDSENEDNENATDNETESDSAETDIAISLPDVWIANRDDTVLLIGSHDMWIFDLDLKSVFEAQLYNFRIRHDLCENTQPSMRFNCGLDEYYLKMYCEHWRIELNYALGIHTKCYIAAQEEGIEYHLSLPHLRDILQSNAWRMLFGTIATVSSDKPFADDNSYSSEIVSESETETDSYDSDST